MDKITIDQLPELFEKIAARFSENEDMLCEMDSKMGDGDLGLTMRKGFGMLPDVLRKMDENDLSKKIRKAGMEMTDIIPSTMGMLMGTGLAYAGKALKGHVEIKANELAVFLEGYAQGIMTRGKCERGDRTVLDSIGTAGDYARKALTEDENASLKKVCIAALQGAEDGTEATKNMRPKYGKAAVHANVAIGTRDQGAEAGRLLVQGLYDYICQ